MTVYQIDASPEELQALAQRLDLATGSDENDDGVLYSYVSDQQAIDVAAGILRQLADARIDCVYRVGDDQNQMTLFASLIAAQLFIQAGIDAQHERVYGEAKRSVWYARGKDSIWFHNMQIKARLWIEDKSNNTLVYRLVLNNGTYFESGDSTPTSVYRERLVQ